MLGDLMASAELGTMLNQVKWPSNDNKCGAASSGCVRALLAWQHYSSYVVG